MWPLRHRKTYNIKSWPPNTPQQTWWTVGKMPTQKKLLFKLNGGVTLDPSIFYLLPTLVESGGVPIWTFFKNSILCILSYHLFKIVSSCILFYHLFKTVSSCILFLIFLFSYLTCNWSIIKFCLQCLKIGSPKKETMKHSVACWFPIFSIKKSIALLQCCILQYSIVLSTVAITIVLSGK